MPPKPNDTKLQFVRDLLVISFELRESLDASIGSWIVGVNSVSSDLSVVGAWYKLSSIGLSHVVVLSTSLK